MLSHDTTVVLIHTLPATVPYTTAAVAGCRCRSLCLSYRCLRQSSNFLQLTASRSLHYSVAESRVPHPTETVSRSAYIRCVTRVRLEEVLATYVGCFFLACPACYLLFRNAQGYWLVFRTLSLFIVCTQQIYQHTNAQDEGTAVHPSAISISIQDIYVTPDFTLFWFVELSGVHRPLLFFVLRFAYLSGTSTT